MNHQRIQTAFFISLLVATGGLAFAMFLPFLGTVVIAATFAVILHPTYRRLRSLFGGRESLAALLTMLGGAIALLIPITLFGLRIFKETAEVYGQLSSNQSWLIHVVNDLILHNLRQMLPGIQVDLNGILRQSLAWVASSLGPLFTGTVQSLVHGFVGTIAMYYLIKDGTYLKEQLIRYSPLADEHDHAIYTRLIRAVRSIMLGSLAIAFLQGMSTGIGLTLFGVPNATLWGSVAAFCALVPVLGTSLVLVPSIIYIFSTGRPEMAIGLTLWGLIAVGLLDNVVGPSFVGRSVRIHPFFVLMSVVSGLAFFGPAGFIFGPLLLSFLFALLDIYRALVLKERSKR